jgi:hypothetical protein
MALMRVGWGHDGVRDVQREVHRVPR